MKPIWAKTVEEMKAAAQEEKDAKATAKAAAKAAARLAKEARASKKSEKVTGNHES